METSRLFPPPTGAHVEIDGGWWAHPAHGVTYDDLPLLPDEMIHFGVPGCAEGHPCGVMCTRLLLHAGDHVAGVLLVGGPVRVTACWPNRCERLN